MAFESPLLNVGQFTASSDYNDAADQFCVVRLTTGGAVIKTTGPTQASLGVLQDRPSSGFAASVMVQGITKVRVVSTAGAAIVPGAKLAGGANGGAVLSTGVGRYTLGRALEALSSATAGIISMLITHEGAGSSGAGTAA